MRVMMASTKAHIKRREEYAYALNRNPERAFFGGRGRRNAHEHTANERKTHLRISRVIHGSHHAVQKTNVHRLAEV